MRTRFAGAAAAGLRLRFTVIFFFRFGVFFFGGSYFRTRSRSEPSAAQEPAMEKAPKALAPVAEMAMRGPSGAKAKAADSSTVRGPDGVARSKDPANGPSARRPPPAAGA